MSDYENSSLVFQLFKQVQLESGHEVIQNKSDFEIKPEIADALSEIPEDAVLLGIARDGLPLLLRLRDPRPGAILVTGDRGTGKTELLKTLIKTAKRFSLAQGSRYLVLSDSPFNFQEIDPFSHAMEVWPAYQNSAVEILHEIASRLQYQDIDRPMVLIIDGFTSILKMDQQAQICMQEILTNGPRLMVWPLVTMNSNMAVRLPQWLDFFRSRIYGKIANNETVEALTPLPGAPLQHLLPGAQFCLRQKSQWLTFWLPHLADDSQC